jgi:hypothetical protein
MWYKSMTSPVSVARSIGSGSEESEHEDLMCERKMGRSTLVLMSFSSEAGVRKYETRLDLFLVGVGEW